MKNYIYGAGASVLILATLAWTVPLGIAAEHGHVEYGHAAGVGSVHFAPREVPFHAAPVVRAEEHAVAAEAHAVRAGEHIAAEAAHAVYRNPYRDDYFRRFPPGYHPFVLNGAQYYGYYSPPVGYQQVVLNGITYFLFGGVYYRPYMYGGQTIYLVVPAPV
jgi:hypothetical protein